MVKHEIVEHNREGTKNYRLVRSEKGQRRKEFFLGRYSTDGEIRYFIESDYLRSSHRCDATARLLDGYYVLFHSQGFDEKIFGVEPDQVKAEKRLREKMCEVLERRLKAEGTPILQPKR